VVIGPIRRMVRAPCKLPASAWLKFRTSWASLSIKQAGVTTIEGAVIKLKDINEREFYALISEYNTQGRDGFSVQTGSLEGARKAA
jgi:hypothetical protein